MKSILLRTGSIQVQPSFLPGSPRVSLSVHDSISGVFSGEKNNAISPRISLHLDVSRRNDTPPPRNSIRRASSESSLIRSKSEVSGGTFSRLSGVGSRSFRKRIPEEECLSEGDDLGGVGSLFLAERSFDRSSFAENWPRSGIPLEELEISGGGIGKGRKSSGGGGGAGGDDCGFGASTGGNADRSKIGAYYQEMLKSDPTNSLLLRNYGKFLHEVEGDTVKAEEYYGRAVLASPGDGEVLSLYGKLIWETQRDEARAKCYFDQAVHASPDDCMVLGSVAQFMWEAEEEDEEDEAMEIKHETSPAMVAAF